MKFKILEAIKNHEAELNEKDKYGQRYTVDFNIMAATVRTAWIIKRDEDFPRFVTCYIK